VALRGAITEELVEKLSSSGERELDLLLKSLMNSRQRIAEC